MAYYRRNYYSNYKTKRLAFNLNRSLKRYKMVVYAIGAIFTIMLLNLKKRNK